MKILGWIVALPFIALALFIVARFVMCRPDGEVVRVATPMVEKIADYIVKHGVPDSLADIPDLPYGLEGCSKSVKYEKEVDFHDTIVKTHKDADWAVYEQKCKFFYKNNEYKVILWFVEHYKYTDRTHGKIGVQFKKTSVGVRINTLNGKLIRDKLGSGFDNRFGFCRQFKQ